MKCNPCLGQVALPAGGSSGGHTKSSQQSRKIVSMRGVFSLSTLPLRHPSRASGLERRGSRPSLQSGWEPNGNNHAAGSSPAAWHEQDSHRTGCWSNMAPTCCLGQWQGSRRRSWPHTGRPGPHHVPAKDTSAWEGPLLLFHTLKCFGIASSVMLDEPLDGDASTALPTPQAVLGKGKNNTGVRWKSSSTKCVGSTHG